MGLSGVHFSMPVWLLGLALLPIIWSFYALYYKKNNAVSKLEAFADPHLLPHLISNVDKKGDVKDRAYYSLLIWSFLWVGILLAMAGPRWDYKEINAFAPASNLVILLDLSKSMDTEDIKPSRLERARQEIEDIARLAKGINIGMIAFASVPHVMTPLTDDQETLKVLLPSMKTDLVYIQGTNLSLALKRAHSMLSSGLGKENHVLIITDGDFQDGAASIFNAERALIEDGMQIHVLALGTEEGAPIPDGKGGYIKDGGKAVIPQLDRDNLHRIAKDGNGIYLEASYQENDTGYILSRVNKTAESEGRKTVRFWEERFYVFLLPIIFLLLPWFRRNASFLVFVFIVVSPNTAQAFDWKGLFLNKDQQGKVAIEEQNYEEAIDKFNDPYNRGVAQYMAGKYDEAIESFQGSALSNNLAKDKYNLGNAQIMAGKIEEAIRSYKNVLKYYPEYEDAAHNLKIAEQLLQQQQQSQDQEQNNKNKDKSSQQDKSSDQEQDNGQKQEQQTESQEDVGDKKKDKAEGAQEEAEEEQKQDKSSESKDGLKDKEDKQGTPEGESKQDNNEEGQPRERTQQDIDADQWLNRIESDPQMFLKNKFYIETRRQGAEKGDNPW